MYSVIFITTVIVIYAFYRWKRKVDKQGKNNTLQRFKNQSRTKKRVKEKFMNSKSNYIMKDPEINIDIMEWDEGNILHEKADIHKARLHKYGKSKLNNQMLFMEKRGKVFKYTNNGEKHYV